jgi:hypothetical protein
VLIAAIKNYLKTGKFTNQIFQEEEEEEKLSPNKKNEDDDDQLEVIDEKMLEE